MDIQPNQDPTPQDPQPQDPTPIPTPMPPAPEPIPGTPPANSMAVPAAIVIAGALVAFALYQRAPAPQQPAGNQQAAAAAAITNVELKPISSSDHLRGNADAGVKVIEFSDLECPFCKHFHPTLQQVMSEYGQDGRIAWVYRHLPLESLHPRAVKEAEASECVNKLGGNEKFWAYIDKIFEVTPANNQLDPALLPQIAENLGINRAQFEQCLSSGEFSQTVAQSVVDATKAGAQGTPYTLVISKSGKQYPINGALPYESVKQTIELALSDK